eukprot:6181286-Pleurochrysis_carterae.AAC.1
MAARSQRDRSEIAAREQRKESEQMRAEKSSVPKSCITDPQPPETRQMAGQGSEFGKGGNKGSEHVNSAFEESG